MKKTLLLILALLFTTFLLPQLNAQNWQQVGKKGDWANTIDVVAMGGYLYSIEKNGTLFRTDKQGNYEQLGNKGEFDNADVLVAMDNEIWTVEDGSLYRTDANTVSWQQVGKSGDWKNTEGMVSLNGRLYSIETDGTLYQTDKDGTWKQKNAPARLVAHSAFLRVVVSFCQQQGTFWTTLGRNQNPAFSGRQHSVFHQNKA